MLLAIFTLLLLTLAGISFLLLADTENLIALQNRNDQQVLYVAEGGARTVVSWFNQPDPGRNHLVPSEEEVDRSLRIGDSDYDGVDDIDVPANGSIDYYKGGASSGGTLLFDKPYHKFTYATFWGSEEHPEILIEDDPEDPDDYMSGLNSLFNVPGTPSLGRVRITEIRVYGPPKDNDLQTRFGIASLLVRAVRETRTPEGGWEVVARRSVRQVLNELPFPPPLGAIETAGNINATGNFAVHWGGSYAEGDIDPQQGANFPGPAVPREDTSRHRYEDFSADAPDCDLGAPGNQNLLEQLLEEPFPIPDPWLLFRAAGQIVGAPNENDQPWPYQYVVGVENDRSEFFQNQTYVFPYVDYDDWKEIAQSGYHNVNYFSYAGSTADGEALFKKDGRGQAGRLQRWVNTERSDVDPGLFFFDTKNGLNPQDDGPGILTEPVKLDSARLSTPGFIMEGFVFLNASEVSSTGLKGKTVTRRINMPGEPFLDEGVDLDGSTLIGDTEAERDTIGNGIWDFDLDNDGHSDGEDWNDLYGSTAFQNFETSHQFAADEYPHGGFDPCSLEDRPHEPFLNLRFPAPEDYADPMPVDFDAELTFPRDLGKDRDENDLTDRVTSLRDPDGALVDLPLNMHGIFYCEGEYYGEGNIAVFGSMLFKKGFNAWGTPDVWFDEGILKGGWPPLAMDIARVYVTQTETTQ